MKTLFLVILFVLISILNVCAEEIQLYNDELTYFSNNDTICANRIYYIDNPVSYQEIVIKDADTDIILEVYNANSETLELVFPENAGNIEVVVTDYSSTGELDLSTEQSIHFTVESCGYEIIKEDYAKQQPYATFTLANNIITVTPPTDVENYEFTYKFVEQDAGREKTEVESFEIPLEGHSVIQFTETYINSEGILVTNYFELEINPMTQSFFIRNVDDFEINTIDIKSLVNTRLLMFILILIFILIILLFKHKRVKKKLKKSNERRR